MNFVPARPALVATVAAALACLGACSTHDDASPTATRSASTTAPLAFASPVAGVSPPFGMDPPVTGRPAASDRSRERVLGSAASDGTGYLVVWHDYRAPSERGFTYAARVDAAGSLLDPVGILVGAGLYPPSVAFDGTGFMVVWDNLRARVSAAGQVLDPGGVAMFAPPAAGDAWAGPIAFDGTNYLVACPACSTLTRVAKDGTVVGSVAASGSQNGLLPSPTGLACDGASCLHAWSVPAGGNNQIQAVRVSNANVVLDATPIVVASTTVGLADSDPSVAFDGTNYLVTWTTSGGAVQGQRVSKAGATVGALVTIAASTSTSDPPAVAFDGTSFQVAWNDGVSPRARKVARVSSAGALLDTGVVVTTTQRAQTKTPAPVTVACAAASCLTAWTSDSSNPQVTAARFAKASEAVLDASPRLVSTSANNERNPRVAWDGTSYMVVWTDDRDAAALSPPPTYAVRVAKDGTLLDATAKKIAIPSDASGVVSEPLLAFDGTSYVLAWSTRGGPSSIRVARMTAAGVLLDPAGIEIETRAADGVDDLACGAGQCAVTYTKADPSDAGNPAAVPFVARVGGGVALDPGGIAIDQDGDHAKAAWNGSSYLLAWTQTTPGDGGNVVTAFGRRLPASGAFLDAAPVPVQIPGAVYGVASDGADFLVGSFQSNGTLSQAYVARVSAAGATLDPGGFRVAESEYDPDFRPALGFDGVRYFNTWAGLAGGAGPILYGASITTGGRVVPAGGFVISASPYGAVAPALAGDGAGTSLVLDAEFNPDAPFGSVRVRGRTVQSSDTFVDAGTIADAAADADLTDAPADASSGDAGRTDAGSSSGDAGGGTSGDGTDDGCSCGVGARAPSRLPATASLLAIALVLRRRRRARPSTHRATPWR